MSGARIALALGVLERAVPLATSAVRRDPLAEDGWQVLIEAHGRQGRPGEAMRAYLSCRQALLDELEVDPSPSTRRALEQALDDNRLAPSGVRPLVPRSIGPAHPARSRSGVASAGGRRRLRVTPDDPMASTPSAG
jgi:DNA-binding SARP family transcriptional activator